MDEDKKKKAKGRKNMPSAPIKAPQSTIKGIGKQGIATGGLVPSVVAPRRGQGANPNPGTGAQIMKGWNYNSARGKRK